MKKIIAILLSLLYAYIFYGSIFILTIPEGAVVFEWATRSFTTGFISIAIFILYFIGFIVLLVKTLMWAKIIPEH